MVLLSKDKTLSSLIQQAMIIPLCIKEKHLQHQRQRIGERKRKAYACLLHAKMQRTYDCQPRCIC